MNRFVTLLKLDAKLAFRHRLVHVVVIIAAIFGVAMGWIFPSELDPGSVDDLHAATAMALDASEMPAPTVLRPGSVKPPFNELFLPILFAVDLCVLGFMFGSVMVLQDKEYQTIRFFRVGPGATWHYLASKLTVNLGLSALNFAILVGLGVPRAAGEPGLFLLVLGICAAMTMLGIGLAVFFRNLAQFFFPLAAIGLLGAMPMYLVFNPTAALDWTRWLPTYHALFGAEAILFTGDSETIRTAFGYMTVFVVLTAILCVVAVHQRLMKEAH